MKKYLYHIISISLLFIYISPYLLSNDFKCLVADNLDQHIAINKILANEDVLSVCSETEVPFIMGGIERGYLKSELNFSLLLYNTFSPLNAYRIIKIFMILVAFIGMFLLLNNFIFNKKNLYVSLLISLGFATLPFFPNGFLTITGIPILLYCYLSIYFNIDKWFNWLVIILFPFFSSLILGNLFFHFFFILIFLVISIRKKHIHLKLILAICLFIFISIIAEYRLFQLLLFSDLTSARSEMLRIGTLNINGVIGTSFLFFINGHRHFSSLHFPFILVIVFLAFFYLKNHSIKKNIIFTFLLIFFIVLFENTFYGWSIFNKFKESNNFINSFTFRFYSVLPFLWYVLLSFSVKSIILSKTKLSLIIKLFLFLVITNNFFGTKEISAENTFYHTYFNANSSTHYSFNNFYSPSFFKKIKNELNIKDDELVACIDIPSVVLNFNSISTIGGFLNNYPLEKKYLIRNLMNNEFSKNQKMKERFDNYGVVCKLQSSELFENSNKEFISNLSINLGLLKEVNCKFIFCSKKINSIDSKFITPFIYRNTLKSPYVETIYVYQL